MELKEIIAQVYNMSATAFKKIEDEIEIVRLRKGEMLFKEGHSCDSIYFIREGILRGFSNWEDKEDIIWFAVTGDAVASMHSIFRNEASVFSAEALIETEVYQMKNKNLETLFEQDHEIANWGRTLAFEEIYALERRYKYVGVGDAYDRYKSFMEMRSKEVVREIPLKYIASYLGITPQTLSKLRYRLVKDNRKRNIVS